MNNIQQLNQDLARFKEIMNVRIEQAKQLDAINNLVENHRLDEVIHNLYTKNELIDFLSSNGLDVNQAMDVDNYYHIKFDAIDKFYYDLIAKISIYNDDFYSVNNSDDKSEEFYDILARHLGEDCYPVRDYEGENLIFKHFENSNASDDVTAKFEEICKQEPNVQINHSALSEEFANWTADHITDSYLIVPTIVY